MAPIHQRQKIREAVKAQLVGKTAAGPRVFETRVVPYRRIELPAIAVYTSTETSSDQQSAPRELKREPRLMVEAAVMLDQNVDDALDAIACEIERAIDADPTFGGTASDAVLVGTELDVITEGERPMGVVQLQYAVTYYTNAPDAADVELDDLKRVDTKTSLSGAVHPDNQAEDRVEGLDE